MESWSVSCYYWDSIWNLTGWRATKNISLVLEDILWHTPCISLHRCHFYVFFSRVMPVMLFNISRFKLGLKATCRFPQWFWTRVCTTAKAFLSHGLNRSATPKWRNAHKIALMILLRLVEGSRISQYKCPIGAGHWIGVQHWHRWIWVAPTIVVGFLLLCLSIESWSCRSWTRTQPSLHLNPTSQLIWQRLEVQTT